MPNNEDDLIFIDLNLPEESDEEVRPVGWRRFANFHTVFAGSFLLIVILLVVFIRNWGTRINLKDVDDLEVAELESSYDHIMPLVSADGYLVRQDVDRILVFGNSYFADDRDSENGMAALLAKRTGAEVINCAVEDSYLACNEYHYNSEKYPMDAFCPFWLVLDLYSGYYKYYDDQAADTLGANLPSGADTVYDTLENLDMSTVDVVVFMYDMADYFMDHQYVDDENRTSLTTTTGNLNAAIQLFTQTWPDVRVIVMSPTYAYYVKEDGTYDDAELYRNSWGPASDYFLFQATICSNDLNVTFLDNYFKTINYDNASDYLTDNIHVNQAARELLTERLAEAIERYNK